MPNDEIKKRIDAIHALRVKRDLIAGTLDDQIKQKTLQLEAFMRGAKVDKERTDTAMAYFTSVKAVEVSDWAKVFAYIEDHKAHDMMQKRLTPKAVTDRLDAGEVIPGLTVKPRTEFVVRALPKKGEEKNDGESS